MRWTFGVLPSKEDVARLKGGKDKKEPDESDSLLTEYSVSRKIPDMLYANPASPKEETLPLEIETEADEEEAEPEEVRIYGELMHAIMERVDTVDDLDRALLRAKTRGFINHQEVPVHRKMLADAIASVEKYGWFAPGRWCSTSVRWVITAN